MLGRKLITVNRFAGSFVLGKWVVSNPTAPTVFTILASVQPLNDNEMQSLDEGRRDASNFKLISSTNLNSVEVAQNNPDKVILFGTEVFEVVQCKRFQSGIISHYNMIVSKAKQ